MTKPTTCLKRDQSIVSNLREYRDEIVEAMRDGRFSGTPRENRFGDDVLQFRQRLTDWMDLLIGHVEAIDGYGSLLAGQTVFELSRPERDAARNRMDARLALDRFWIDIACTLKSHLSAERLAELREHYDEAMRSLVREPRFHVRTLLIGDCLMGETAGITMDKTCRAGVSFDPFPINARTPTQLAQSIDRLGQNEYDAIFFSPFSHARLPEIDALLDPRKAWQISKRVDTLVDAILSQTESLIDVLAHRFECPIYIHNSALAIRATSDAKALVLDLLTTRQRRRARDRINSWILNSIALRNAAGQRNFHVIDEDKIARSIGRRKIGRFLHDSEFQHATVLSLALSREYARHLSVLAKLKGRKLVICDLDNTLWDGVIGEGKVDHYIDRQEYLKRLKERSGIVLSIASKNDVANVNFSGGVLNFKDFVAAQISWGSKVGSIKRIQESLNLQFRHMVFIDDRHDERAFVAEAYPDIIVLDATDPESWRQISLWADITDGSSDVDRTRLYQEQDARRMAMSHENVVEKISADVIDKLELKVEVREAAKTDLKRFAELINRTNQWNLTGSRVTNKALNERLNSVDSLLLIASAKDKFGDLGDVCAAVVQRSSETASIDSFVLSCRVFGYGIETTMLREIVRISATRWPATRLEARYVSTNQNHMARDMYSDNGFESLGSGHYFFAP